MSVHDKARIFGDSSKARSTNNSTFINPEISKLEQLLNEGDSEIELKEQYKDVILVLGNTGSGKSTVVQLLAGDDDKLLAEKVGSGEYLIEDGNRISNSNSTTASHTVFPELVVDTSTNAAFYDCPGFQDTRSTIIDIASTYFIKKVTRHAKNVKFILVVNHSSVRKGVDRLDFMNLLRHATDFLKNIDKFQKSIALAVTKVDNKYEEDSTGVLVLVPDEQEIELISDFLNGVKLEIRQSSGHSNDFRRKGISLINAILGSEGKARIGIFRRPNRAGPLSKIESIQNGKKYFQKIISQEIQFTKKNDDDFGYTVSERSKNDIILLLDEFSGRVWSDTSQIIEKMRDYYESAVKNMSIKIEYLSKSMKFEPNYNEARIFSHQLSMGLQAVTELLKEVKSLPTDEATVIISEKLGKLNIQSCMDDIKQISTKGKKMLNLKVLGDAKLMTRPWEDLFQKLENFLRKAELEVQTDVNNLIGEIRTDVDFIINNIAEYIERSYQSKEQHHDIQELPKEIHEGYLIIQSLNNGLKNINSTQELSKIIKDNIKYSDYPDIIFGAERLFHFGEYMEFLTILSNGTPLPTWSTNWNKPFEKTERYLRESNSWYPFLHVLYKTLSNCSEENNCNGFDSDPVTNHYSFTNLLQKVKKLNIAGHATVENIQVSERRLKELNEVLNLTIGRKVTLYCESDTLMVKGINIRSSDFVNSNGTLKMLCGDKTKSINVFALNKIIIDNDLDVKGKNINVIIIAPKWVIRGQKVINLSGLDGEPHSPPRARGNEKARGDDGLPGNPGGSSGSFFGIGEQYSNKNSSLKIIANGGNGGPGQHGGNGADGRDGLTAPTNYSYYITTHYCKSSFCHDNGSLLRDFDCHYTLMGASIALSFFTVGGIAPVAWVKIDGKRGEKGTDGGNGGVAGNGGNAGDIKMISLSAADSKISVENISGQLGIPGAFGAKGNGGKDGNNVKLVCEMGLLFNGYKISWRDLTEEKVESRATSGIDGKGNANSKGALGVEKSAIINLVSIINQYKNYLRERIISADNLFEKPALHHFFEELENNHSILDVYNPLGFVEELRDLEDQIYKFNKEDKADQTSFYQSFLRRLERYAESNVKSDEQKKVLSYLYTAALSKMQELTSESRFSLVIDVNEYLDTILKNVEDLKNLQDKNNKANIIKSYQKDYNDGMNKKIKEARSFIDGHVVAEIEKINKQILDKISLLITEVAELQEKAKENEATLVKKKKELERALVVNAIFGVVKAAGEAIGMMGGVGAAVGGAIGFTASMAQPLVLGKQTPDPAPITLPNAVQGAHTMIGTFYGQRLSNLQKELEVISQELRSSSGKLTSLTKKVDGIKHKLDKKGCSVKDAKFELNEALKKEEDELKKRGYKEKGKEFYENNKETINKLKQISNLGVPVYKKLKQDKNRIKAIDNDLEKVRDNIQMINKYEDKIYDTITPMLKSAQTDLKIVQEGLVQKSQVTLDVTKWQVQSTLKDLKFQMQKLTQGFQVEKDFEHYIEKLEEAMTVIINLFDRIQQYQEQKNLANFIGDISSASANSIRVSTPEISKAISDLDINIVSNLVLEQHNTAMMALKQWVFPFASDYVKNRVLPSTLTLDIGNAQDLVSRAIQEITEAKSKIDNYKSRVYMHDSHRHFASFHSKSPATKPFFVWKSMEHKETIGKLLAGKEVVLKADVTMSLPGKDAIKFNKIRINFKSVNETLQNEINEQLKGFKVSATHLGNSYYRWNEKFYLITSESQEIQYSFHEDSYGVPVIRNEVYNKMKNGDLMLSPYTMWKIRLTRAQEGESFDELEAYKEIVDLELEGEGSYVDKGVNITVDGYYEADDSFQNGRHYYMEYPQKSLRTKRSVRPPSSIEDAVNSGASRTTSWVGTLLGGVRNLVRTLTYSTINGQVDAINESKEISNDSDIKNSKFYANHALPFEMEQKVHSNVCGEYAKEDLDMEDHQWLDKIDINGLLTWGTLFARKWTGYRPKRENPQNHENTKDILLGIHSYELVDKFIEQVLDHIQASGIESSIIIENGELYKKAIESVRHNLSKGDVERVTGSLFELVNKYIFDSFPYHDVKEKLKADLPRIQGELHKLATWKYGTPMPREITARGLDFQEVSFTNPMHFRDEIELSTSFNHLHQMTADNRHIAY